MKLLTSISDIIRIVTGAAASIDVHASAVDVAPGPVFSTYRKNTAISTAATTTVVESPASGNSRNVKHLNVTNRHATIPCQVTVQHFDGTTSIDLMAVTLLPGENLIFTQEGEWKHHDAQGGEYSYSGPPVANLGINGTIAETHPRELLSETNSTVPTASGTLWMQAIYLKAGQKVNNISVSSGTTAAGTPTNCIAGIYDANRNLLAQTANQGTAAWAANTLKTIPLTAEFRVPYSGLYYIGFFMTATTIITMKGNTARGANQLAGAAPILQGASSTGLTTALPNPAAAITVSSASMYAAVS